MRGVLEGLTPDIVSEMVIRQWHENTGNRLRIESKKDFKKRIGKSCDKSDALFILVELAVRLGLMGEMEDVVIDKRASVIWEQNMKLHDVVGGSDMDLDW